MSTNKAPSRNWSDVQLVLAALSMSLTIGLWNIFARSDPGLTKQAAQQSSTPTPVAQAATGVATPVVLPPVKIMLGGVAPQTTIIVQQPSARRNNGGGGGGGGGSVTTTRSS